MANLDFKSLFTTYPNRNAELRMVSRQAYEFGKTVAKEADSAMSAGMHEHAIKRQHSYLDYVDSMLVALHARPIPDLPASHPLSFAINMAEPYTFFTTDVNGEEVPLNEQTQLIAEYWMLFAVELAKSQSASIAGSLTDFDFERGKNNIGTIRKLLDEIVSRPVLDLPETAVPGSNVGEASEVVWQK
jgi:hypothetical protein